MALTVSQQTGSILGGTPVIIGASMPLTTELSFAAELPAGWTSAVINSGVVTTDAYATLLGTGIDASSTAAIRSGATDFDAFDVRLDAEIRRPKATTTSLDMLTLRITTGTSVAAVGFRRNGYTDQVFADFTSPTGTDSSHFELSEDEDFDDRALRLVRNGRFVWALWGDVMVGTFSDLETGAGRLTVRADNAATGLYVIAAVNSLTITHAASIGGQLLRAITPAQDRVTGRSPPALRGLQATLTEEDFEVFGPEGSTTVSGGWQYHMPGHVDRQQASIYASSMFPKYDPD